MLNIKDLISQEPEWVASYIVSSIPFFNYNDGNRLQMASNHHVQALPLVHSEVPTIYTDLYYDNLSFFHIESPVSGTVKEVTHFTILIEADNGSLHQVAVPYTLTILVKPGDKVQVGQTIARHKYALDERNRIRVGRDALVLLSSWEGYTYEDAIVADNSIVDQFECIRPIYEEIELKGNYIDFTQEFDIGKTLKAGIYAKLFKDKLFPDIHEELSVQTKTKIVDIIFSPVVKRTQSRIIQKSGPQIQRLFKKYGVDLLEPAKYKLLDVLISSQLSKKAGDFVLLKWFGIQYHKTELGDKFTNRHGNKGVISLFETMPTIRQRSLTFTPEFALNPFGLARMNVGQLVEMHWAFLLKYVARNLARKLRQDKTKSDEDKVKMLVTAFVSYVDPVAGEKLLKRAQQVGADNFLLFVERYGLRVEISNRKSLRSKDYLYKVLKLWKKFDLPIYIEVKGKKVAYGVMYMHKLILTADTKYTSTTVDSESGQRIGEYEHWSLLNAYQYKYIEEIATRADTLAIQEFMKDAIKGELKDPKEYTKDMALLKQTHALLSAMGVRIPDLMRNYREDLKATYSYFKWLASITENFEYQDIVKLLEKELGYEQGKTNETSEGTSDTTEAS